MSGICTLTSLDMFLHQGTSHGEDIIDDLCKKLFLECGFDESFDTVIVVSDTTGNMNKFSMLLERGAVYPIYTVQITCSSSQPKWL